MSFVGTRPETVKYVDKYKPEYMATLLLPAGITSEASIRYKDEATLAPYIGFTENEVQKLAKEYQQDFDEVKRWYDGYLLNEYQVYNPRAVVSVMLRGEFKSYWSETASYDAIVPLINMDFDGLKTAIIEMLSGAEVKVNTATFKNDTLNIKSRDDVLTYMIHQL